MGLGLGDRVLGLGFRDIGLGFGFEIHCMGLALDLMPKYVVGVVHIWTFFLPETIDIEIHI